MRSETTHDRVLEFMAKLGRGVKGAGRIYLTGGASAVLFGWRSATMDIDLQADPEPLGFFEALPDIKEALDINLELASPADFIPQLPGWQDRSVFIGRYGSVDFYHYDFYSQALAKLERYHDRDLLDVTAMLERGFIKKERLLELFETIKPKLIRYPSISPSAFADRVLQFTTNGDKAENP